MNIISFERKQKLLTKNQKKSYAKIWDICENKFENKCLKDKKYCKDHYHYKGEYIDTVYSIYNLKHSVPKTLL